MNKAWLKAAGVRVIRSIAQAALATIGATALFTEVNWVVVGSTALLTGIASLLTSVINLPEAEGE